MTSNQQTQIKSIIFLILIQYSFLLSTFKINNYIEDIVKINDFPKLSSSILKNHIDLLNKVQLKSKKLACSTIFSNFISSLSGRSQLNDILNSINPYTSSSYGSKTYFKVKENQFKKVVSFVKKECFEKINSQSVIDKLTRRGFLSNSEDEDEFLLNILFSFSVGYKDDEISRREGEDLEKKDEKNEKQSRREDL